MNEEERYLFDLQGYLVVKNAIDPQTLQEMNGWLDVQAERDPEWQGGTGNGHLDNPILWGPPFRGLMDNPTVLPILKSLMGTTLRLDHDYAIFLQPGHTGLPLHGPTQWPYDPIHFYHCINGEIFCGLCVATYALTDVPPGAGGLAVIPGSHKSAFKTPEDIRKFQRESPIVQQVPTEAGDCVIFTEALIHGTLPWKGPGVRRTLFYKYAPGSLSWSNQVYFGQERVAGIESIAAELSETQRQLLTPPSANDFRPWRKKG
jgi:hypothetical protein